MLSSVKKEKKVYGYLYNLNSCHLFCQLFVIIYQTIRFKIFFLSYQCFCVEMK